MEIHYHHISFDVPDWNEGSYRDMARPCPAARPWKMEHKEKTDIAVMLMTGYAGYPGELIRPGEDLYHRGYDVYCPRESGCGTSGEDFQQTTRHDWIKSAENCYRDISRRHQIVYLVGHSMGGLNAIILAHKFHVSRLVLLAPALDVKAFDDEKTMAMLRAAKAPIKIEWHSDPSYHLHYENAPCDDEYLGARYFSWIYPKQMLEMAQLQKEASAILPLLKANTRLITSGKDALVGENCATIFASEKKLGYNDHVHVENATHFSMYDPDPKAEDEAMEAVVSWLDA